MPRLGRNSVIIHDDHAEVVLTDPHGLAVASALVSLSDLEKIAGYRWCRRKAGACTYASGRLLVGGKKSATLMHRLILDAPPAITGLEVDHVNGDGLDNRRENIHLVTRGENHQNMARRKSKSGYRGVYYHRQTGTWAARCNVDGRSYSFGYHPTPEAAHEVVSAARDRLMSNHQTRPPRE